MECFCCLRNTQDKLADRKSPYGRIFGTPFESPIIPIGTLFIVALFLRNTHVIIINLGKKGFQEGSLDTLFLEDVGPET